LSVGTDTLRGDRTPATGLGQGLVFMIRYDRRVRLLAMSLTALAGYVDAIGFIKLGGFFVSFMSGNSTRLAVGVAEGSRHAAIAASLIAFFIIGVIAGSIAGRLAGPHQRPVVLAVVAPWAQSAHREQQ
jgi:uncharacterized membrane protein YoaK (UPF0700 family)